MTAVGEGGREGRLAWYRALVGGGGGGGGGLSGSGFFLIAERRGSDSVVEDIIIRLDRDFEAFQCLELAAFIHVHIGIITIIRFLNSGSGQDDDRLTGRIAYAAKSLV